MRGRFITLEGIEGSGKSTQIKILAEYLADRGIKCITTREPGGTELAERIRAVLLGDSDETMHDDTELLLMFAARTQHVHTKIKPTLAQGTWVLCDRFLDATFAYQGYGRGMPIQRIQQLVDWALADFCIDLTVLFDMPVTAALKRVSLRGAKDRFEKEESAFFEKIRQGYLCLAQENSNRIVTIDADQPIEQVSTRMLQQIDQYLQVTGE